MSATQNPLVQAEEFLAVSETERAPAASSLDALLHTRRSGGSLEGYRCPDQGRRVSRRVHHGAHADAARRAHQVPRRRRPGYQGRGWQRGNGTRRGLVARREVGRSFFGGGGGGKIWRREEFGEEMNLENRGIWRIGEFGEYGNLENTGIWKSTPSILSTGPHGPHRQSRGARSARTSPPQRARAARASEGV